MKRVYFEEEKKVFYEEISNMSQLASKKIGFMRKNRLGLFVSSMLAGIFVGIAVLLVFTIGGLMNGAPITRVLMGLSFGIALSLVVIAGAELFTGNNLVMGVGILKKTVTIPQLVKFWVICYIGNWIGSILLAFLFYQADFVKGDIGQFISNAAAAKMSIDFMPLLVRGVLCNMLVCLATWCGGKCKSESGKLIMIFWCLFAFITTGFEHSIANMTLLTISLFEPMNAGITMSGYFYNILTVSLGNIIGGVALVAIPYYLISKEGEK